MSEQPSQSPMTETLEKTPPHGMKGQIQSEMLLQPTHVLWASLAVVAIVLVVLLVFGFLFWRRRQKLVIANPPLWINEPSAWAKLRKVIEAISVPTESDLEQSSKSHQYWSEFSSEVSLCLRRGLEIRTGLPFAERTNEEIFRSLASGELKLAVMSDYELRQILTRLDQVRFGGAALNREEANDILKSLKNWCQRLEQEGVFEQSIPSSLQNEKHLDSKAGGANVFTP